MQTTPHPSRAYLVETLPQDLYENYAAKQSGEALVALVQRAVEDIAIAAMYWSLRPGTAAADEDGLDRTRLDELGSWRGERLFAALAAAAQRGVQIRIVQDAAFAARGPAEAEQLVREFPENVSVRTAALHLWYGAGTMHQKFVVVDRRHVYLGSANMDWRSLSQVKELGVVIENDAQLGGELARHFDTWWQFAALPPHPTLLQQPASVASRLAPRWSVLHEKSERSPLAGMEAGTWETPLRIRWNERDGRAFLAGSPPALCTGRTTELDALLRTIAAAAETLDLSVMHFLPLGALPARDGAEAQVWWWPALHDALLHAAARGTSIRLLASRWAHNPAPMLPLLVALQETAEAVAPGKLAIRLYTMPGWDQTQGPERRYPDYSRVNHPKFVASETRLHLTTSNMAWRDFHVSGGVALNTDHPDLVAGAQAIFERDWSSPYALALPR